MNNKQLKAALPEDGRGTWRDPNHPGLELIGRKSGASWYLRHRVDGQRIRDRLGRWPALGHRDAVAAAKVLESNVATRHAAGVDVVAQREEKKAERKRLREAPSLRFVISGDPSDRKAVCYANVRLAGQRTGARTERNLISFLGPLLDKPIYEVTRRDVLRLVDEKRVDYPSSADAALRMMKPLFAWVAEKGWGENVLADVKVGQTRKRDRYLSLKELGAVIAALEARPDRIGALAVRTMIATGQRESMVAHMAKPDLDLEARVWELDGTKTKNGRPHTVHLNDNAVRAIEAALEQHKHPELVFVGATGETPFSGWSRLKLWLDRDTGVTGWRFHDLRRTFVTHLADRGVDPVVADKILNHVAAGTQSDIQRIYQKSQFLTQRRDALNIWSEIMDQARAIASGDNVTELQVNG